MWVLECFFWLVPQRPGWGHGHRSFLVLWEVIQERTPTSGEGKHDLLFFPGSSQAGAEGSF